MSICCITASEIQRPQLYSKDDLSVKVWGAVTFKSRIDPFDHIGVWESVRLHDPKCPEESWKFFNARICLMPHSTTGLDSFVIVFEDCKRIKVNMD